MASFERVGKRWKAVIRRKGYPKKTKTFDTKREAAAWAARFEENLAASYDESALSRLTFAMILSRYRDEMTPSKKSSRTETLRINRFLRDFPRLCNRPVPDITPSDIARWRDQRLKNVSRASVNREWNTLSAAYNHAIRGWGIPLPENPFRRVARPEKGKARNTIISSEQQTEIVRALSYTRGEQPQTSRQTAAWCFLFALETAMRAGEILKLQSGDITGRIALLRDTKNGEDRRVPLSSAALDLLSLLPDGLPVPITAQSLDVLFRRYRPAELGHIHFHDTRHTALTKLAKKINNPMDLAKISGHKDLKILLNTYYNPDDDHLMSLLD